MIVGSDWQAAAIQLLIKKNRKSGRVKYPDECRMFTIMNKYVLFPVLNEWLSMNELCALDTAMCSSVTRPAFLALIGSFCSAPFSGSIVTYNSDYDVLGYLTWLKLRRIEVSRVMLSFTQPVSIDWTENIAVPRSVNELTTRLSSVFFRAPLSAPAAPSPPPPGEPIYLPSRVEDLSISGVSDETVFDQLKCNAKTNLQRLTLTHFQIESSHRINCVTGFILSHADSLQELTIHNCKLVSLIVIRAVLQNCHQLTRLSIVECKNNATIKGKLFLPPSTDFSKWSIQCPHLRYVSFFQFPCMGDHFLTHMVSSCAASLTHITVLQAPISDVSVHCIARLCPQLVSLAVETYCSHISDASVAAVAAQCPRLRCLRINCSDLKWLTAKSVRQVIHSCADLRYLNCGDVLTRQDCEQLAVPGRLRVERTGRLSGLFDACPPE